MYKFLAHIIFLALMSSFSILSSAQEEHKITTRKINDNFWILHGGNGLGANVGVSIGSDGIVLIDSMNTGTGKLLIEAIRKISDKPIKYVINTHDHGDHRGGNEELVSLGATVIYPNFLKYTSYQGATRDIQFEDRMSFKANGELFTLYHVKSHTWNDVIVHMKKNNAVFTGDNHATDWGPNIGVLGYNGHRIIFDLVKSLTNEDSLIVPGHKSLADIKQFEQYDNKTKEWYQHVLSLHDKGINANDIVANKKNQTLLAWFHEGKIPQWLRPDRQLTRVEGTIYADARGSYEMGKEQLQSYLGKYLLNDGSEVNVFADNTSVYAQKDESFMVNLLIKSTTKFDFNGWTENEHLKFDFDDKGQANKLSFSINGNEQFIALKQ